MYRAQSRNTTPMTRNVPPTMPMPSAAGRSGVADGPDGGGGADQEEDHAADEHRDPCRPHGAPLVEVCAEAIRGRPAMRGGVANATRATSTARGQRAGAVERLAHRRDRRLHAGEQLELAERLGQQQVEPGHDPAAGALGAGGQRGRPRVVDRVEEHRRRTPRDGGAPAGRRRPWARSRSPRRRPTPSARRPSRRRSAARRGRGDRRELVDRLRAAGDDGDRCRRPARGRRGQRGPGGAAGAEHRDSAPPAPTPACAAAPTMPGDVGVLRVPGAVRPAYQRVGRADRGRDRRRPSSATVSADLLERHGQRQPGPLRAEPGDEAGQVGLVALDRRRRTSRSGPAAA